MQKAEEFYKKLVDDNFAKSLQSAKKQQEYIKTSTARYHGYFVHTLYMPKMFTEEMENGLKKPQDFKYTVEFDQGGSGTRKYIIAKCKKC